MKTYKAYFEYCAEWLKSLEITKSDGDEICEGGKESVEILQNIFNAHPDIFPTPKNKEKIKEIFEIDDDIENIIESEIHEHIISMKRISYSLYVRKDEFFRIVTEENVATKENFSQLHCDAMIYILELELDCDYETLSEEEQDSIRSFILDINIYPYMNIDGYSIFMGEFSNANVYYLENNSELTEFTGEVTVYSPDFEHKDD